MKVFSELYDVLEVIFLFFLEIKNGYVTDSDQQNMRRSEVYEF